MVNLWVMQAMSLFRPPVVAVSNPWHSANDTCPVDILLHRAIATSMLGSFINSATTVIASGLVHRFTLCPETWHTPHFLRRSLLDMMIIVYNWVLIRQGGDGANCFIFLTLFYKVCIHYIC